MLKWNSAEHLQLETNLAASNLRWLNDNIFYILFFMQSLQVPSYTHFFIDFNHLVDLSQS